MVSYSSAVQMPPDKFGWDPPDAGSRFSERRRAPRYPLKWSVTLFEPLRRTQITSETIDVSVSGCRIVSRGEVIDLESIVQLEIQRRSEALNIWARVARFASENSVALAFLRTRAEDQQQLLRWILDEVHPTQ